MVSKAIRETVSFVVFRDPIAHPNVRSDVRFGVLFIITETKRKVFRFQETILRFGETGLLGYIMRDTIMSILYFPCILLMRNMEMMKSCVTRAMASNFNK